LPSVYTTPSNCGWGGVYVRFLGLPEGKIPFSAAAEVGWRHY